MTTLARTMLRSDGNWNLIMTDEEYADIRHRYTDLSDNSQIESLALDLVELALDKRLEVRRTSHGEGADLEVDINGKDRVLIEVKGTKDFEPFKGLVLNSREQHDRFVNGDSIILRVMGVGRRDPQLAVVSPINCRVKRADRWTIGPAS